jgi:hypothetical protein
VGVPEQQPVSSETEPIEEKQRTENRPRDPVTGKFQKPDTEYSRAQKEQERKDRSWQRLQAEKEQFRQQTAQWEEQQRMAQLEQTRRQYQPLKKDGLTAQEYADGAAVFEREGDYENAYKARRVAEEMFQQEQGRAQRMQMQQIAQVEPKAFDPSTPIGGHLERIIAQNDWLYRIPNGLIRAAEVADMLTKMGSISELQDENEQLRAELEKHRRKGQPARGGYATPRLSEKEFDEMNVDEMEAHLKGITSEADNYR